MRWQPGKNRKPKPEKSILSTSVILGDDKVICEQLLIGKKGLTVRRAQLKRKDFVTEMAAMLVNEEEEGEQEEMKEKVNEEKVEKSEAEKDEEKEEEEEETADEESDDSDDGQNEDDTDTEDSDDSPDTEEDAPIRNVPIDGCQIVSAFFVCHVVVLILAAVFAFLR
ncbi:unnamed protein product [Caenorhabditis sp. 36 PRJEB53466]|nr:unnamed protein product [Caenorhabditis sp. 36 PRJEB53466]